MNFNYTTYAIDDLTMLAIDMAHRGYKKDEKRLLLLCDTLKDSVKFIMPDGGRLFGGSGPAFTRRDIKFLRLPYPSIVLEYFISKGKFHEGTSIPSSKRIALAVEIPDGIIVQSIYFYDHLSIWHPCACAAFIPREQNTPKKDLLYLHKIENGKKSDLKWELLIFFNDAYSEYKNKHGLKKAMKDYSLDLLDEMNSVLSFLIAKSCSNVYEKTGKRQDKINKKRAKTGRQPFFTYKILEIQVPIIGSKSGSEDDEKNKRKSPRIHLRQGHVRRLKSGVNIWVNHCIVGSKKHGLINKDYRYSDNPHFSKNLRLCKQWRT